MSGLRRSLTVVGLLAVVTLPSVARAATASVTLNSGPLTVTTPAIDSIAAAPGGWTAAIHAFAVVDATGHGTGWRLYMHATTVSGATVSVTMPTAVDVYNIAKPANAASIVSPVTISGLPAVVAYAKIHTGRGTFTFTGVRLFVADRVPPTGLRLQLTIVSGA